jgi:hypothetical protein
MLANFLTISLLSVCVLSEVPSFPLYNAAAEG